MRMILRKTPLKVYSNPKIDEMPLKFSIPPSGWKKVYLMLEE